MLSSFVLRPVYTSFSRSIKTFSGNQGLNFKEPLIFDLSTDGLSGSRVSKPVLPDYEGTDRLGALRRTDSIGLPSLSEPEVVRHFTRLSTKNFNVDSGIYPLGSCTMKYNPRINEAVSRLPGFADIHPLQPIETVQGALELIYTMTEFLKKITGMHGATVMPAAGSHGEATGLMAISSALHATGQRHKNIILVPESAHGTNPASAHVCGFKVVTVKGNANGTLDLDALKKAIEQHTGKVAGIMITNPNTVGLFEKDICEISEIIHEEGGYVYMDGANLNAIMANVNISKMGVDAMHINLHKTFSTPHGGGGPGSGPVVFSERLSSYAPVPRVVLKDGKYWVEDHSELALGRVKSFLGQMGMFVRAAAYILALGEKGLKQSSEDAILSANYIQENIKDLISLANPGTTCMHECVTSDKYLEGSGVSTMDIAKGLLDEGMHPPTVYFPLVVSGAMMIEPTESEGLKAIDQLIGTLRHLAEKAKSPDGRDELKAGPHHTPVKRCDEAQAARNPKLVA